MTNQYFHLIDTREKILWVIKEHGIEGIELVLSNLREEYADLYKKLEKGMNVIQLTEKVLEEYQQNKQAEKERNIIDISNYFKNKSSSSDNSINQNIFIFSKDNE